MQALLLRRWLAALLLVGFGLSVDALSHKKRPFKRAFAPLQPSIQVLRRHQAGFPQQQPQQKRSTSQRGEVLPTDTFLLRFLLDADPVSLVLRPSTTLVHPGGIKVVAAGQPTQFLLADRVRAYEGVIVREEHVSQYWAEEGARLARTEPHDSPRLRGFASISLREDDAWEGALFLDGDYVHVKPVHAYLRDKSELDPDAPVPALVRRGRVGGGTVLLRERDTMTADEFDRRSLNARSVCSHDRLLANQEQAQHDAFSLQASVKPAWTPLKMPWLFPSFSDASLEDASVRYPPLVRRHAGEPAPLRHLLPRQDVVGGNSTSSFSNSIGSTVGCPKEQKVVYIGVAVDCTAVQALGSQDEARTSALAYVNSVSTLYARTFNVSIGVVELNVMGETCPTAATASEPWNVGCDASGVNLNSRLSLFSEWRSNKGGADGAGLWHLLTACQTGSEVGVAWLSALCRVQASSSQGQTTSGTAVTALTDRTWQVVAHEIGHNFGAIHDCDTGCNSQTDTQQGVSCCPLTTSTCDANSAFIMSPVSSRNVSTFSQCSIGNVCTTIANSLNTTCLVDPGDRTTLSANQCGNGILEPGEECDPGAEGSGCCTSECRLREGALCDPDNFSCCTSECQYAAASVVCRPSVNAECDPEERCSGTSASCPTDVHADNGASCGASGQNLYCANGQCTSRDLQCRNEGSALNITRACSNSIDSSCRLTCADPRSGNSCVLLDSSFTDGTECGLAGRCSRGVCNNGSFSSTVQAWVKRNPQIAIPVFVVGGLVILFILFAIVRCCITKRKASHTPGSSRYVTARDARRRKKDQSRSARRQAAQAPPMQDYNRPGLAPQASQQASARNSGLGTDSRTDLMQEARNNGPMASYRPPSYPPPAAGAPPMPPASYQPYQSIPYQPPSRNSYQPPSNRGSHNPFADQPSAPTRVSRILNGPRPVSPARTTDTSNWLSDEEVRRMNGPGQ